MEIIHQNGIIHGDIIEDILYARDGEVFKINWAYRLEKTNQITT